MPESKHPNVSAQMVIVWRGKVYALPEQELGPWFDIPPEGPEAVGMEPIGSFTPHSHRGQSFRRFSSGDGLPRQSRREFELGEHLAAIFDIFASWDESGE